MDNEVTLGARDVRTMIHPYTNLVKHAQDGPLIISGGDGIYVIDEAGNRYMEAMAGLWCAGLGFSEPRLAEAAYDQLKKLPFYHIFAGRSHQPGIELAERLVEMAPGDMAKVFFVNSGSEANDTQVKIVRYYWGALGKPEKRKIIARTRAYHGVTMASASLTGLPYVHAGFQLPIEDIRHTMSPHYYREHLDGESEDAFATRCAEELEKMILAEGPETVGAFIAEPIIGAGGVIPPAAGYFEKIQAVTRKYDLLFIADEVICGFGRTGNMFGSETYGIQPDSISIAKQLSAAYLPIAAVLVNKRIGEVITERSGELGTFGHGYTYSGHPVCAAVALETLKIYDEIDVVARVRKLAPVFEERVARLAEKPLVGDTRAKGLIGAVEVMADGAKRVPFDAKDMMGMKVQLAAQKRGVLVRAIGDNVAFCPPMIIEPEQIHDLFDVVADALDEVYAGLQAQAA